jgi:hypothetical protein
MIDNTVKIVSHESYPGLSIVEQAAFDFAVMKQKMFAFAVPSKWWPLISSVFYPIRLIPVASPFYLSPHPLALDEPCD